MKWLPVILLYILRMPPAVAAGTDAGTTTFERDVRPILDRHCTACHSGWFPDAGLDLSERDEILEGARSGPLVVAGKPDKGWLMFSITRATGRQQMPPEGKPGLSDEEKAVLIRWIEQGLR